MTRLSGRPGVRAVAMKQVDRDDSYRQHNKHGGELPSSVTVFVLLVV
jgi:hypothetical protein